MFRTFILILMLLVLCGNPFTRRGGISSASEKSHPEIIDKSNVPTSIEYGLSCVDSIVVQSVNFSNLDIVSTSWNMTMEDVRSFFEHARLTTESEVAEIVSKNYSPFSITGEVWLDGQRNNYTISPAGTAILFPTSFDQNSQHIFFVNDEYVTIMQDKLPYDLELKVLSYHKKSYDNDDDLGKWCKNWRLSATDIDSYFTLCKPWDENVKGAVLTLFYNYNCEINGYLEMNDRIYRYWLWCNGPFILTPVQSNGYGERLNFVCQDEAGLKYLYEIEKNPTLDE